jgi:hypothetical protein
MNSCSCRTAALRIFIRNVAELHNAGSTAVQRRAISSAPLVSRPPPSQAPSLPSYGFLQRSFSWTALVRDEKRELEPVISKRGTATRQWSRKAEARWPKSSPRTRSPKQPEPITEESGTASDSESQVDWRAQKAALKAKFPEGWQPRKKLSPDALAGIRALHAQFPDEYPTEVLANKFEVSPEAIRRILRSKWTPTQEEEADRQERWFKRGMNVWSRWAELGKKPPVRWRNQGIARRPSNNEKRSRSSAQRRLSKTLM